jgi:hypothetical protein
MDNINTDVANQLSQGWNNRDINCTKSVKCKDTLETELTSYYLPEVNIYIDDVSVEIQSAITTISIHINDIVDLFYEETPEEDTCTFILRNSNEIIISLTRQ